MVLKQSRILTALVAATVLLSAVAPAAVAATDSPSSDETAYTGTHVSFETSGDGVANYSVDGETMVETVGVESESNYRQRTDVGAELDLTAVTSIQAAGLSMASTTTASATVRAENGAEIRAHDNGHGILVVDAGDEDQLVRANVSSDADASADGEDRVVVTTGDGAEGAFLVVGEGSVDVDSEGDVVAEVGAEGRLVFRAYPDGERDDDDERNERLIANGSAVGEVYATSESGGEVVVDAVTYGQDATVTAAQTSEGAVEVTVDRAESEGRVLITTVSKEAVGTLDDVQVRVDGEAAVRAESYSEVVAATDGGDSSAYLVRQTTEASAQAEVLVGVNHFSERTVAIEGTESGTADDGDDSTSTSSPGFGFAAALVALAAAALVARRQR